MKQSAVLCDGAMGTLLYSKGIFINRCYDELNLSQPDLIRGIHHEYLQAGAEIIETNTFGGNSFRLARHSMASQVREINLAGARLAREAAKSFDVWVAGSVGPLGVRIEPLGKTSFEEARTAFHEQIAALVEGGVDLLMLETFGYLEELHQAVLAAREVHLAGATVLRGPMGFGKSSRLHTAKILRLSMDLPLVIEIVDSEDKINLFLPMLDEMMKGGLVTLEKVRVIDYRAEEIPPTQ